MSSRDRRRAERRKRKDRSAGRRPAAEASEETGAGATAADPASPAAAPASGEAAPNVEDIAAEAEARGVPKSEIRNERARESLDPLEEGERPLVVTLGAILSLAIALITVGAWVAGAEVDIVNSTESERPNAVQVFAPAILFSVMGVGMWRVRYWAVLGFQAIMAIFMVGAVLTLIAATSILQALSVALVLTIAGAFFWFTVKAMARIQMPDRIEPRRR